MLIFVVFFTKKNNKKTCDRWDKSTVTNLIRPECVMVLILFIGVMKWPLILLYPEQNLRPFLCLSKNKVSYFKIWLQTFVCQFFFLFNPETSLSFCHPSKKISSKAIFQLWAGVARNFSFPIPVTLWGLTQFLANQKAAMRRFYQ